MLSASEFRKAARRQGSVDRRLFLTYLAGLTTAPLATAIGSTTSTRFSRDPFTLGVASGDPTARGVVIWTRLAPEPLEPGGGLDPLPIPVQWELAEDESFSKPVARGNVHAAPQLGHSVRIEVDDLKPDRWYFYRFASGDAVSPIGRTRTVPGRSALPDRFRFAFASCQHYEAGYYNAYSHMAQQDLDLVVHLGDYIYEGAASEGKVRRHVGSEIRSLDDYRIRHALYRSDPMLQGMHARCPWMVAWDDHEFDNNYANAISEESGADPVEFMLRRANSYQAYYEAMPLRRRSLPKGPNMRMYRKVSFGRLAEMFVLDTRQYRTDQPNGDVKHPLNDACSSPEATLLGATQREWLEASLLASGGTWNILAQQVMMAMVDLAEGSDDRYSMDQWPGYLHERSQLLSFLSERRIPNPVVLTGDIHSNWVNDLRIDDRRQEAPVVATELVGTSISSGGNGPVSSPAIQRTLSENPHVKFHDRQRGYVACEVSKDQWRTDYFAVADVTTPDGATNKLASFVIEAAQPGAKPA